jgi:hypothetical protein
MDKTEKSYRNASVIFITVFAILILLPAIFINTKEGISEEEHRELAGFPTIRNEEGQWNTQWQKEFENYLYDRIGGRSLFIATAAAAKLGAFHLSPSDIVHAGKDGWYFYTLEDSIGIGRRDYLFPDDWTDQLAKNQQALSDYYQRKGADYFYMPIPGKPSVYPEFIGGGDFSTGSTIIDQVTAALREQTDVRVIEIKDALLGSKSEGQLFLKQDFHWDTLGSYIAYERILEEMNASFVTKDAAPIAVSIGEANYGPGEVSGYFGNILPDEYAPDVAFEVHSRQITSGDYFDRISELCRDAGLPTRALDHEIDVLENPRAEYGTLLIYGDSQSLLHRKLPLYLAEHFKTVVRVGNIPDTYEPLDDFVQPDVVLYERIERQIAIEYTVPSFR